MGRPRKNEEDKRVRQFRIRMTSEEDQQLKELSKLYGVSQAHIVRTAVQLIYNYEFENQQTKENEHEA